MFRLGIRRFDQYSAHTHDVNRRLSYELLSAAHSGGEREIELFEAIVRDLRLSLGICRTTARGRFQAFDPFVNQHLLSHFEHGRELVVHDWAASDCLTSSEWALSLFEHFPLARFTASDLMLFLVELTLEDQDILILEPSGGAVQYIRGPFVCYLDRPEARSAIVNRVLAAHAHRTLRRRRDEFLAVIAALGDKDSVVHGRIYARRLPLLHPDAEHLQAADPRFTIRAHSVFEPLTEPADVIRTMNIFNPGYFGPEMLRTGRDAVWSSLREGGMWIVGRTVGTQSDEVQHMATIFGKTSDGFRTVAEAGGGSEIAGLVREFRTLTTS